MNDAKAKPKPAKLEEYSINYNVYEGLSEAPTV